MNFLPLWDTTSDILSSVVFQSGTGAIAKIGINTTKPASALDVVGGATVRGTLALPSIGTATAAGGRNSQPQTQSASSFNSGTGKAVSETFQWQAEPAGNDTATPSGTLNLLFGSGTNKPAETGLNIASNGQIAFAAGQTFPGTGNGTITGVTAGTGLTGGGASGTVTLNVDTTKVPQISGGNSFSGNQSVSGNVVATGSVSGATASFSGSNSSQILNVAQNGTGWGIFSSNAGPLAAIYGTSSSASGVGVQGFNTASTGGTAMYAATNSIGGIALFAANGATTGNSLGIFAQTNSPNGTALFATNTAGGTAAKFGGPVNVAGKSRNDL